MAAAGPHSATSNGGLGQGETSRREAGDESDHGNGVVSGSVETNGSASPVEVMANAGLSVSTGREGAHTLISYPICLAFMHSHMRLKPVTAEDDQGSAAKKSTGSAVLKNCSSGILGAILVS